MYTAALRSLRGMRLQVAPGLRPSKRTSTLLLGFCVSPSSAATMVCFLWASLVTIGQLMMLEASLSLLRDDTSAVRRRCNEMVGFRKQVLVMDLWRFRTLPCFVL